MEPVDDVITFGFDDIPTTKLGRAAYDGDPKRVHEAIASGIDWSEEGEYPLRGALYGGRTALVAALLDAGSPVSDDMYAIAYHHGPASLNALPPRPDLVRKLEQEARPARLAWALVKGDEATARRLIKEGAPVNEPVLVSYGFGLLPPIHYAARREHAAEALELLIEAGADVNSLDEEGKSPMRRVAENPFLSRAERRQALQRLKARGGVLTPAPRRRWIAFLVHWGDRLSENG